MITGDISPSLQATIPPPPDYVSNKPLHRNSEPQSPADSEWLSLGEPNTRLGKKQESKPQVFIRIRPLKQADIHAGEKPYIRTLVPRKRPKSPGASVYASSDATSSTLTPSIFDSSPGCSRRSKSKVSRNQADQAKNLPRKLSKCLVAGTENQEKFQFDQVISASLSHGECYERTVGKLVQRNLRNGSDTVIALFGHPKSGRTYTLNGKRGGRKSANADNPKQTSCITENDGILLRAVDDLFRACHDSSTQNQSVSVLMAYYAIACENGKVRDMFSRFNDKERKLENGLSYLKVQSVGEVRRLMDRVTEKRAPDIAKGRTSHIFYVFHVKSKRIHDGGEKFLSQVAFMKISVSAKACLTPLALPYTGNKPARDLLHGIADCEEAIQEGISQTSGTFHRKIDELVQDDASVMLIGCVSPLRSELERSMDTLTAASTFILDDTKSKSVAQPKIVSTSKPPLETKKLPSMESPQSGILKELQNSLRTADDATRRAMESSASLENLASKWRSNREKYMEHRTEEKRINTRNMHSNHSPSGQCAKKSTTRSPKADTRSGQDRFQCEAGKERCQSISCENERLKLAVKGLKCESELQGMKIQALENELKNVSTQLDEERLVSAKLDDIRMLLKKKAKLQEGRIQKLSPRSTSIHSVVNMSDISAHTDEISLAKSTNENVVKEAEGSLLALLDDESEASTPIFCSEENAASLNSSEAAFEKSVTTKREPIEPFCWDANGAICDCQTSLIPSENNDKFEFYLPKLNVSCLCGKHQIRLSTSKKKISSILRPWQSQFLVSQGISDVEHFTNVHQTQETTLVREMIKWRAREGLKLMPKRACAVALFIWARSCKAALRSAKIGGTQSR